MSNTKIQMKYHDTGVMRK